MATATSAGLLLHRVRADGTREVLLVHPGGPFWARRDDGAWSIPKGELDQGEDELPAARREFAEELGSPAPDGVPYVELGSVRQRSGKIVLAWAVEADLDASVVVSNTFTMQWPPRSGRQATFPEVDRAAWFDVATARVKLVAGQDALLDRLESVLTDGPGTR